MGGKRVRCIGGPYDGHEVDGLVDAFCMATFPSDGDHPQIWGTYRYDAFLNAYYWTWELRTQERQVEAGSPGYEGDETAAATPRRNRFVRRRDDRDGRGSRGA